MGDFYANTYNPDVLSCLANLSNDEVFTPPNIVNRMLDMLPQELFSDPSTTFLDPACKSGVFLREIAKRLLTGLKDKMPDLADRIDHIFRNQLYGIAITEMTSLLSRRSVYCSKYPNGKYSIVQFDDAEGNIRFKKIQHVWRNGKCVFCGASQSEYNRDEALETHAYELIHTIKPEDIFNMKFDVIIGNPPYQLSDGGAKASAKPIYQLFVQQAKKLNPRYLTMIIPSRWFAGGRSELDSFRVEMLNDRHIRCLHDFPNASDAFPGIDISGGINYFLWDRDNVGEAKITTQRGELINSMTRFLLEQDSDIFIRYNEAIPIVRKVGIPTHEKSFSSLVSASKPFGLRTFFRDFSKTSFPGAIKIYTSAGKGYIKQSQVESNMQWVGNWKVFIAGAYGERINENFWVTGKPFIGEPNSCCTETYFLIGPFGNKRECENVSAYIATRFFRFLVHLHKNTQHATAKVYSLVPLQDFTEPWTDEKLYAKYGITKEEQAFIESMIRPMDLNGSNNE
jgi:site-specific DNA-methyltransferase (adenine-specific)